MRVVIVASGEPDPADTRWLDEADLVVAADGGAEWLDRADRRPDLLVGDLDSAPPALVARLERDGTTVERHPTDKDSSDSELAVAAARERRASEIVVLGAVGGRRLDHELANVLLLADPALAGVPARIARGATTVRLVRGGETLAIDGGPGTTVSLLPIGGDAAGVTTHGLRWPLRGDGLRMGGARGLSNVVVGDATVTLEAGALLVVETTEEEPSS